MLRGKGNGGRVIDFGVQEQWYPALREKALATSGMRRKAHDGGTL